MFGLDAAGKVLLKVGRAFFENVHVPLRPCPDESARLQCGAADTASTPHTTHAGVLHLA